MPVGGKPGIVRGCKKEVKMAGAPPAALQPHGRLPVAPAGAAGIRRHHPVALALLHRESHQAVVRFPPERFLRLLPAEPHGVLVLESRQQAVRQIQVPGAELHLRVVYNQPALREVVDVRLHKAVETRHALGAFAPFPYQVERLLGGGAVEQHRRIQTPALHQLGRGGRLAPVGRVPPDVHPIAGLADLDIPELPGDVAEKGGERFSHDASFPCCRTGCPHPQCRAPRRSRPIRIPRGSRTANRRRGTGFP